MILFSTKYVVEGAIVYLRKYTPSGSGAKGCPTGVNPRFVELNILKSLGVKGKAITGYPGTVMLIVGAVIAISYTELSAIPKVWVLYVLITNISKVVAMVFKIKMPEDWSYPLSPGIGYMIS
jgi:hypothetical protein